MVKRTFAVVMIISILIGVSGCMKKSYTAEEKKEMALEYLKNKYGEEFVPASMEGSGWGQGHDVFVLYPKKGTNKDAFYLWGTIKDDGSYAMHDAYFGCIIRPEYEEVMSSFVKEIYKDFKLYTYFGEGVFPDRLNKDTKISEIYNKDEFFSSETTIFVKESSSKRIKEYESLEKIAERMKENKLVGKIKIYIVFDDKFELIKRDIFDTNINTKEYFTKDSEKYIYVFDDLTIGDIELGGKRWED